MKTKENNSIIVQSGSVEEKEGDVLINWANSEFREGPPSFYNILKKTGYQPLSAIETFKANISKGRVVEGDSLTTIPGMIDYNLILHSLLPKENFTFSWLNIMKTLNTYKKDNICRTVFFEIPDWNNLFNFIGEFFVYQSLVTNIKFVIVCHEMELKFLTSIIKKLGKSFLIKEKKNHLDKFLLDIFSQIISYVHLLNGNYKKKLQKET